MTGRPLSYFPDNHSKKLYSRWCKRCGEKYKGSRTSKVCPGCNLTGHNRWVKENFSIEEEVL